MKREHLVVLAAFLAGIILANLMEDELLVTYGMFNEYYLHRYSYQMIDENRLFCHILLERGKTAFLIFLLGQVLGAGIFSALLQAVVGVTFGFLTVAALVNLGVRGIVVALAGLFPQWVFYLAGMVYYVRCRKERYDEFLPGAPHNSQVVGVIGRIPVKAARLLVLLMLLLTGMIVETYLNPLIFEALSEFI